MAYRRGAVLLAAFVAVSLVGAPVTMADWGAQAGFSAEEISEDQIQEQTPVVRYENLSANARDAVRSAVESSDGHHTVYGREDWPDRFSYSDHVEPGRGTYVVADGGHYYRVTTYAGGGFPFVYWLYELPFVVYGVVLGFVAVQTHRGKRSALAATLPAVLGVAFHVLGPAFDFPLFTPGQFVGVGILSTTVVGAGLVWQSVTYSRG